MIEWKKHSEHPVPVGVEVLTRQTREHDYQGFRRYSFTYSLTAFSRPADSEPAKYNKDYYVERRGGNDWAAPRDFEWILLEQEKTVKLEEKQ